MSPLRVHHKDYDFTWLEQRLKPLGFRWIFITRRSESFLAVRSERPKISGNPHPYDNIQTFLDEQDLMRQLVSQSHLPVLNIDISNNYVHAAVECIADWMEGTGGLWMD